MKNIKIEQKSKYYAMLYREIRGRIFSCVRPFYEWAVSNLDP